MYGLKMMLTFAEIQNFLNQVSVENQPELNISVVRNITVEPIEPYLAYWAYQMGFAAQVQWGGYDSSIQDAIANNSQLFNSQTDCVLVFLKLEVLSAHLAQCFPTLTAKEIDSECERILEYAQTIIQGLRRQTTAMILWMGFERPLYPSWGILDLQRQTGQTATIQRLNAAIHSLLLGQENSYFVDLDLSLARLGSHHYFDYRYWHIGRSPYTRQALGEIATEVFKYIRALKGQNKKCLVLDCDNTLWGGVIGEDGLAGIKLSANSYPGSCFYEFQQAILNLYHRGILIALCSKNNEAEVWDVFHNHPDMVLQESHIACAQINWDDKAHNLHQIAQELNIGLDSLVFVDDSEFEVNLVRQLLPEVETIHLPRKRSTEYRQMLSSCGWFDTLALTQEDLDRGAMYSAAQQRAQAQKQFMSITQYHESLEMVAEISFADEFSMPRVAQLTQKTNQFNLTTQRYSEADIAGFISCSTSDVLYLQLKDKFGVYGIVGVCIVIYQDAHAVIDSLLLSCRVLGRHVEDAFLHEILKLVTHRECQTIEGQYQPTQKNMQVQSFYCDRSFTEQSAGRYHLDLIHCQDVPASRFVGEIISQVAKGG